MTKVPPCVGQWIGQYLNADAPLRIYDVGSREGGRMRKAFRNPNWVYFGLDIRSGKNVDIVLTKPYDWEESLLAGIASVVVLYAVMEHVPFFWKWLKAVDRILKSGGFVLWAGPHKWRTHEYPVDCWRFMPGSVKVIADWCGWKVLELETVKHPLGTMLYGWFHKPSK